VSASDKEELEDVDGDQKTKDELDEEVNKKYEESKSQVN